MRISKIRKNKINNMQIITYIGMQHSKQRGMCTAAMITIWFRLIKRLIIRAGLL